MLTSPGSHQKTCTVK